MTIRKRDNSLAPNEQLPGPQTTGFEHPAVYMSLVDDVGIYVLFHPQLFKYLL